MDLYIMIGPAASGKTTVAKEMQRVLECDRLSYDDLKERLFGTADMRPDEEQGKLLHGESLRVMDSAIKNKRSLIIDATNLTVGTRKRYIAKYGEYFDSVVAVYVKTSEQNALIFNQIRDRHVPEDVIRSMYEKLQPPMADEGFDTIVTIENGLAKEREIEREEPDR